MKTVSDLAGESLGEEMFSSVPIKSPRSVLSPCKTWNPLFKNRTSTDKAAARKQLMMMIGSEVDPQFNLGCKPNFCRLLKLEKKTTISDLPGELIEEEILSRVPMTSLRSVRSTCKKWNSLCKKQILFAKAAGFAARKQFTGFMMMESKICLLKFHLQGIRNDHDLVDPCSIEQVSVLDEIEMSNVFHCNGLLLCVLRDNSRLLVWNPYLGQRKWIQPMENTFNSRCDRFALGYDNQGNHKILRVFGQCDPITRTQVFGFQLYDFSSDSWKVLHITPDWEIWPLQRGVSLKGNAYFPAQKKITPTTVQVGRRIRRQATKIGGFFICFDFTSESFGPLLPLPFQPKSGEIFATLSCVREEQLAVLSQRRRSLETIKICVTDMIGPNAVSWTEFLELPAGAFSVSASAGSFFIDQEKKIAVVFNLERLSSKDCSYQTARIIGQDGCFKTVNIKEALTLPLGTVMVFGQEMYRYPLVCSSYVPSLVQLQIDGSTQM